MSQFESPQETTNPYQPPSAQVDHTLQNTQPEFKVYEPFSIAIATIFGSCLAGGLLLYSNLDNFKYKLTSWIILVVTSFSTLAMLLYFILGGAKSLLYYIAINFIAAVIIMLICHLVLADKIEQHKQRGQLIHTHLRALVIGLLSCFGLLLMTGTAWILAIRLH
ncbi:hypothetical protein ACUR5C_15865 [Aliikangiella sp. IMCC44653]